MCYHLQICTSQYDLIQTKSSGINVPLFSIDVGFYLYAVQHLPAQKLNELNMTL